jgi:hypothetical protein
MVDSDSPASNPRRVLWVAVAVGISVGLILSGLEIESHRPPAPFDTEVAPSGSHWTLTPPASWCGSRYANGGVEYFCNPPGTANIELKVVAPSRVSGSVQVDGPSAIWVYPSVWGCVVAVELSGNAHSCAPPYQPPPWRTWTTNFSSAARIDLAQLALNVTAQTGVLPPADWTLLVVDAGAWNETATLLSSVELRSP